MRLTAIFCSLALGLVCVDVSKAETITVSEGTNIALAISPDGQQIVFDLQGTLWILPIGGGEAKAITDPLADARQPSWSPDGSRIAFQSYSDGGWHIWTVDPDGADPRQVTAGGFDEREPAWSPDGQWIAFSSDRSASYDIWVVRPDGSEPRQVTISEANEFAPSWSPDGSDIGYASDRENGGGVYAIAFEGVGERLLAPMEGTLSGVSWRPNGASILVVSTAADTSTLNMLDVSTGIVSQVTKPREDVFGFRPAWISDDTYLYTADAKIKQAQVGSANAKAISFKATVNIKRAPYKRKIYDLTGAGARPVKGIRGPMVSPDGHSIVFAALGDIWQSDMTGRARKLTDDVALDYDPSWSRDGSKIVFVSDRSGKTELWQHDIATGVQTQLTNTPNEVQFPVYSPDGKRIAFFQVAGLAGLGGGLLNVLDLDAGTIKQVRNSIWGPGRISWSPDGRKVVLSALARGSSRFREGYSQFLVAEVDGDEDHFVTPEPDRSLAWRGADGPVWSPDGKWLAYVFDGRLWRVEVDGDGQLAGAPIQMSEGLAADPSWTADSSALVYLSVDRLKRAMLDGATTDIPLDLDYSPAIPEGTWVLHAGKLFDGTKNAYRSNVVIVIKDNQIEKIEPHRARDEGVRVVDASTKVVMPGLIESHTHMAAPFGSRLGQVWLAMGVTSVREPGAMPYDALERREAWSSGRRLGPREFFAGGLTDGARVFYGFANSVVTHEHMKLEVERARRLDYDMIKTYVRMPDSLQKQFVAGAHAIGIPVSSHEIYPATSYGADGVEHLRGTSRRGYSPKQSELAIAYGDVIDIVAKSGMTMTPTIALQGGFNRAALRDPAMLQHPMYLSLYRDDERASGAAFIERMRSSLPSLDRSVLAMGEAVKAIIDRGGTILAGTDSPFVPFGLSFLVELQIYEEAGLTPFQVLQTATVAPARFLGLDRHLGTVEAGKLADLLIVDGDPLVRIGDLEHIEAVISDGRYLTRAELLQKPVP